MLGLPPSILVKRARATKERRERVHVDGAVLRAGYKRSARIINVRPEGSMLSWKQPRCYLQSKTCSFGVDGVKEVSVQTSQIFWETICVV